MMSRAPAAPLSGRTFLVVDDQNFIRGIVSRALKQLGARSVVEAADGFAAVQQITGQTGGGNLDHLLRDNPAFAEDLRTSRPQIDCVVTDIRMFPMNGLELLKAIRLGMAGLPKDTPVLMMSAHSDESLIGAAIALDANGFALKPISQQAICDKVLRALSTRINLKPEEVYRLLVIPTLDEKSLFTDTAASLDKMVQLITAMDVAKLRGDAAMEINWKALREGDVLAEPLSTSTGTLVVPAGTHVSPNLLQALEDLSGMVSLQEKAKVKRKLM
jgi:CheY-like chemotaxis protein